VFPITAALPPVGGVLGDLPLATYYLSLSFTRMVLAYALSLAFALVYGYFAATHRTGERVLLPVLDILQSVPILGFFPVAILFFVAVSPGWVGPNIASIFLIFTSMSWNMAFGVYESLKSVPNDLREAGDSFGVHGRQRWRVLLVPATVNRLVYNSVLSWTGGWFFLVAAELFSAGTGPPIRLPGIGSYLGLAAAAGNGNELVAGLAVLIVLIVALDLLLWRPLGRWAERFRYDTTPSGEDSAVTPRRTNGTPLRRAAGFVARGVRTGVERVTTPFHFAASPSLAGRPPRNRPWLRSVGTYLALGGLLVVCWLLLIAMAVGVFQAFTGPISPNVSAQMRELPLADLYSLGRVVGAYVVCLAISVPLAIGITARPRVYRVGMPLIEIVASIPATAFFPVIVFALEPYLGINFVAILMLMTGMLWYLFFNILSGLRGIPPDLEEAARSYGLPRREVYRRLILPALVPALITGSITAFGGGWNTLILAEFLEGGRFSTLGVGQLLNVGLDEVGGTPLFVGALLALVVTVVALNELLWKPLYRRAVDRFRYD
jgi:NitT/TauT family transport system permease protein